MPPTALLLALLLNYPFQQFLQTVSPAIMDKEMLPYKPRIFSGLDSIFLITTWACSSSDLCRKNAKDLFKLGLLGIAHVAFSWIVIGTRSLFFLFSLPVFIAIGPVHSVSLILEKAIPKNKFCNITLSYLGLLAVSIHQVPQARLYALVMFGTAYCMHLLGDGFEEDLEEEHSERQ